MEKLNVLIGILGVCILTAFSCEKSNNSEAGICGQINFKPIVLSDSCSTIVINENVEDQFLVINSKEELQQNISFRSTIGDKGCDQAEKQFSIDFNQYTLLIGKKKIGLSTGRLINQSIIKNCQSDSYTYSATIKVDEGYTVLSNFIFAVLIPKISENTTVKFDIQAIN